MNAAVPTIVSKQIYGAIDDAPTKFLLWMATPRLTAYVYPGCIVLLHYIPKFSSRLERPATKWDSKASTATGDVVDKKVTLAIWEPRYLNLLKNFVNVPNLSMIHTNLAAMPPPILLDPMSDSATGATSI